MEQNPQTNREQASWLPWKKGSSYAVLFFAWILTIIFFFILSFFLHNYIRGSAQEQLEVRADDVVSEIQNHFETYVDALRATRALYDSSEEVSREEWKIFTDTLQAEERYPGLAGISYAEYVEPNDRTAYEKKMNNDPLYKALKPEQIRIYPERKGAEYYIPITYGSPVNEKTALGFDLSSDPIREVTYREAKLTGKPITTGIVDLIGNLTGKKGFVIALPIYEEKLLPYEVEANSPFVGYINAVFEIETLFTEIFSRSPTARSFAIQIYDISNERRELVYNSLGTSLYDSSLLSLNLETERELVIPGRTWVMIVHPLARVDLTEGRWIYPWILLATGISISTLVFLLVLLLSTSRFSALALANSLSQKFKLSEKRLRFLYDISADPTLSAADQIDALLQRALIELDMENGIVSHIVDNTYTVEAIISNLDVKKGAVFDLPETYCSLTLKANEPLAVEHFGNSQWCKHPAYAAMKLESYIGAPITIRGKRYGTLNFSSAKAKNKKFTDSDKQFVQLMAQWVGTALERQKTNFEVEQGREQLKHLINGLPIGILMEDMEGVIQQVNFSFRKMFGITHGAIKEQSIKANELFELLKGNLKEPQEFIERLSKIAELGQEHHDEEFVLEDGRILLCDYLSLESTDYESGSVWIFRDATKEKHIQEMKDDFVSLVAHQLKTPVAQLKWYAENLLEGLLGPLNEEQKEYIRDMQSITTNNFNLISNLLNISRLKRGVVDVDLNPTPLIPLLEDVAKQYERMASEKKISLVFEKPDHEITLNIDAEKTRECVANLVNNATKFTEQGSVTIRLSDDSSFVKIEIIDTGCGIPEDQLKFMFQKDKVLEGAPEAEKGAGLGLYIIKSFMNMQNGDVAVQSTVNQGTTFTLTFPKNNGN